ncbi:hypothetical protein NM688_g1933 [Phlebia brevispora]|uniref:Uncharacterized protein n=1 Tax=Phlebia brevispora TaxID=194682 RepID=A0ACC1TA50_9APHY|nr:hypothetical protein NM688_g1933 [Phlebia brevispora]
MSTSTVTVLHVASASPTDTQAAQPPIIYFFQLTSRLSIAAATFALKTSRTLWSFLAYAFGPLSSLFAALSSPVLYLLSPAFLLVNILVNVFVYQPYNILVQLMHAFYPIYAFIVIVVILATAIGFSARLGTYLTRFIFFHSKKSTVQRSMTETGATQEKTRKKVQIKEEEKPRRELSRHR